MKAITIYTFAYPMDILKNHKRKCTKASLVAQTVKCLPAMRETRVRSLGWEDLLEKEMATHSSTLAWKIPWTERFLRAW